MLTQGKHLLELWLALEQKCSTYTNVVNMFSTLDSQVSPWPLISSHKIWLKTIKLIWTKLFSSTTVPFQTSLKCLQYQICSALCGTAQLFYLLFTDLHRQKRKWKASKHSNMHEKPTGRYPYFTKDNHFRCLIFDFNSWTLLSLVWCKKTNLQFQMFTIMKKKDMLADDSLLSLHQLQPYNNSRQDISCRKRWILNRFNIV